MPPAKNLPESEKKARQKTYSARYYVKHRAQIQKKVKDYKDKNLAKAVSSNNDGSTKNVSDYSEAYSEAAAWQATRNRSSDTITDPRELAPARVTIESNVPEIALVYSAFKPKNKPIWGCNQASAKCGKLVDTVRFE